LFFDGLLGGESAAIEVKPFTSCCDVGLSDHPINQINQMDENRMKQVDVKHQENHHGITKCCQLDR
jgi:hypothetical protein